MEVHRRRGACTHVRTSSPSPSPSTLPAADVHVCDVRARMCELGAVPPPRTSNFPLLTTYSSEAASPVSPSLMRISPGTTMRSYISDTTLRCTPGSSRLNSSSLPSAFCAWVAQCGVAQHAHHNRTHAPPPPPVFAAAAALRLRLPHAAAAAPRRTSMNV